MLPGLELLARPHLAVSPQGMPHSGQVESGANPYAIGVVGGKLAHQPHNMEEALATARMLESKGYNFSVGIAQVNRANLGRYGLDSYRKAFNACDNLAAGAQILARCHDSAHGDWGKAFSCYYSGNFTTGFRDGYVQKVYVSMNRAAAAGLAVTTPALDAATVVPTRTRPTAGVAADGSALPSLVVYSGDNANYRIALRSMPMAAVATAPASRLSPVTPVNTSNDRPLAAASMAGFPRASTSATAPLHDDTRPPSSTAPIRQPTPPEFAGAAADGVFKPQVRGPGDPAAASAARVAGAPIPQHDHADLRMEHRDAAFVF
jgi:type IV secretion system protein VirB1